MFQDARQPKLSSAAVFVKRLHDLAGVWLKLVYMTCPYVFIKICLWAFLFSLSCWYYILGSRISNALNVDAAVQKKGYVDLHDMAKEDSLLCKYGYTLPKDPTCNQLCSWTTTDPSTFLIRGKTYLDDRKKVSSSFKWWVFLF